MTPQVSLANKIEVPKINLDIFGLQTKLCIDVSKWKIGNCELFFVSKLDYFVATTTMYVTKVDISDFLKLEQSYTDLYI